LGAILLSGTVIPRLRQTPALSVHSSHELGTTLVSRSCQFDLAKDAAITPDLPTRKSAPFTGPTWPQLAPHNSSGLSLARPKSRHLNCKSQTARQAGRKCNLAHIAANLLVPIRGRPNSISPLLLLLLLLQDLTVIVQAGELYLQTGLSPCGPQEVLRGRIGAEGLANTRARQLDG